MEHIQRGIISPELCSEQGLNAIIDGLSDLSDLSDESDLERGAAARPTGCPSAHGQPSCPTPDPVPDPAVDLDSIPETIRLTRRSGKISPRSDRSTSGQCRSPGTTTDLRTAPNQQRSALAVRALNVVLENHWDAIVGCSFGLSQYIADHAPFLRWAGSVRRLARSIGSHLSFGIVDAVPKEQTASLAKELISTTVCLPNCLFNPIVLWIAIRVANDIEEIPHCGDEPYGWRYIYHVLLNASTARWGRPGEVFMHHDDIISIANGEREATRFSWNTCDSWFIDPVSTFTSGMAPVAQAILTSRHAFRPNLYHGNPMPERFLDSYGQLQRALAAFDGLLIYPIAISMNACYRIPSFAQNLYHRRNQDINIAEWIGNGLQVEVCRKQSIPVHSFHDAAWRRILTPDGLGIYESTAHQGRDDTLQKWFD